MYGNFVLFDDAGKLEKGEQVYLGEVKGKNEAWLRDMLFENPEIIPTDDIDSTFGPFYAKNFALMPDKSTRARDRLHALLQGKRHHVARWDCH